MMVRIADALEVNPADLFIRDSSKSKIEIKNTLRACFDSILAEFDTMVY